MISNEMERTSKVLTINCAQSVICKICTKQKQQMNKTMKKMVTMGTIWTLIPLWHVTVFSNSLGGRVFLKRDLKASSNAIKLVFFEMFRDWDRWIFVVGSAASITSIEF